MPHTREPSRLPGLALIVALTVSGTASAHFVLESPAASTEQNALGDPQKAAPCGDNGNAVPTGAVTTYQSGQTITVTINETIFHPGHYRIALAVNDVSELPPEPIVTPGNTPCGSAPIDTAPVFPVLADGVFEHTQPFNGPQSIDITLPDDVTCTKCTLQIIQFMSDHALNDPGGCYYHHCADIAIESDPMTTSSSSSASGAGGAVGAGGAATGNGGAGAGMDTDEDGGCSCAFAGSDEGSKSPATLLGLLGLAALAAAGRRSSAGSISSDATEER